MNKKIFGNSKEQATTTPDFVEPVIEMRELSDEVWIMALKDLVHAGLFIPKGTTFKLKKTHADYHVMHGAAKIV